MICTRAEILLALGRESSATAAEVALLDVLMPLVDSVIGDFLRRNVKYQQHVEYLPMGLATTGDDNVALDDADIRVTSNIVTIRGRAFEGTSILQLTHTPVALAGLKIREQPDGYAGQSDDAFSAATVLTEGVDYFLDVDDTENLSMTGHVHRFGAWPTEPRSLKVTYYGGYTAEQLNGDMAGSIKLAAILSNVKAFNQFKSFQSSATGPKTSESIGKYSYTRGLSQVFAGGGFTIPYEAQRLLMPHRSMSRLFG